MILLELVQEHPCPRLACHIRPKIRGFSEKIQLPVINIGRLYFKL